MVTVTKRFNFCYAHHLPGHERCGEVHGHNGVLDVTVTGSTAGDGMVIDFSELEALVHDLVLHDFDHNNLNAVPPFDRIPPTAENIAEYAARAIRAEVKERGLRLLSVRMYETHNSWAEWRGEGLE